MAIPTYDGLFNPLLQALRELGGSASVSEQEGAAAGILKLTNEEEAEIHRGNRTKLSYRLAWARNYLKRFGLLENSTRGVWALTARGSATDTGDPAEVNRIVKAQDVAQETEMPDEDASVSQCASQTGKKKHSKQSRACLPGRLRRSANDYCANRASFKLRF